MRILVIGSGGREHALAWKLSQSPRVSQLWVAPGNGGTATLPKCENVDLAADDLTGLRDFALRQPADLTVVGPEAPLAAGIVDLFQTAGLPIFGPTQAAARLESSKAIAKRFMRQHNIPTAQAAIFTDFDEATRYLRGLDDPPVVKASGLAAGKGVLLPATKAEAAAILQMMLLNHQFGEAGETVLLEERLSGPELSVLAFCDGKTALVMPGAQDHKRLLDNDLGPNTGGMGAFAPSPLATPELLAQVEETIIRPTLAGMAATGTPYVGVLYAGLILTGQGPKVLEYNCRFGDPEAQVLLPLLETDLVELLLACSEGRLAEVELRWRAGAAVTVVMAARGYPGEYEVGVPITRIEEAEARGCLVFHAGTKWKDGRLVTNGGRVLSVTAVGPTLQSAVAQVYGGVRRIHFNGAHYRTDIGRKAGSGE
ncbi:MAG TPA: phosphoribosylamine--glycine ligase [Caldilineaceae bacterium]|nr:phosphoribosylamine--glycine ligase [Caldilineaceae bacterium]